MRQIPLRGVLEGPDPADRETLRPVRLRLEEGLDLVLVGIG